MLSWPCVFPNTATTEFSTGSIRTRTASSTGQYGNIYPSCQTNTECQLFQYCPTRRDILEYNFYTLRMSVLWLKSGYTVKYRLSPREIPCALTIFYRVSLLSSKYRYSKKGCLTGHYQLARNNGFFWSPKNIQPWILKQSEIKKFTKKVVNSLKISNSCHCVSKY